MEPFLCSTILPTTAPKATMTLTFQNTEGLLPHKDTILENSQIISFIETWLPRYAYLPTSLLPNFKPIYKLRSDSSHSQNILYTSLANADRGGVAIFVQNDLQFTERVYDTHNLGYVAILIEKSIVCIHRKYLQTTYISLTSIL